MSDSKMVLVPRDVLATLVTAAAAHRAYLVDAAIQAGLKGETTDAAFLTKMSQQFGVVVMAAKEALQ